MNGKGRLHYPTIRQVHPEKSGGRPTQVAYERTKHLSGGVSVSSPGSIASISSDGGIATTASYVRETGSSVEGHGGHWHDASWSFREDEGEAGRKGLDSHYELYVVLNTTQPNIITKIWGKAVVESKDGKTELGIGSLKNPFVRIINLHHWQRSKIPK